MSGILSLQGCYNDKDSSKKYFTRKIFQKDDKLPKVNYQYEKRQKELEKKKKKAEKEKRKEIKKTNPPKETPAPPSEK